MHWNAGRGRNGAVSCSGGNAGCLCTWYICSVTHKLLTRVVQKLKFSERRAHAGLQWERRACPVPPMGGNAEDPLGGLATTAGAVGLGTHLDRWVLVTRVGMLFSAGFDLRGGFQGGVPPRSNPSVFARSGHASRTLPGEARLVLCLHLQKVKRRQKG